MHRKAATVTLNMYQIIFVKPNTLFYAYYNITRIVKYNVANVGPSSERNNFLLSAEGPTFERPSSTSICI